MEERYEDIFRTCYPAIVKYLQISHNLNRHEAEDIASEAFLLMYRKWDTIEHHNRGAMYRWAMLTAVNLLKNQQKKQSRKPIVLSLEQDILPQHIPYSEEWFAGDFSPNTYQTYADRVQAFLSPNERNLFVCKVLKHMNDAEIAEELHISLGTLRTRWSRLRKKISRHWDEIIGEA